MTPIVIAERRLMRLIRDLKMGRTLNLHKDPG